MASGPVIGTPLDKLTIVSAKNGTKFLYPKSEDSELDLGGVKTESQGVDGSGTLVASTNRTKVTLKCTITNSPQDTDRNEYDFLVACRNTVNDKLQFTMEFLDGTSYSAMGVIVGDLMWNSTKAEVALTVDFSPNSLQRLS